MDDPGVGAATLAAELVAQLTDLRKHALGFWSVGSRALPAFCQLSERHAVEGVVVFAGRAGQSARLVRTLGVRAIRCGPMEGLLAVFAGGGPKDYRGFVAAGQRHPLLLSIVSTETMR